MQKLSPEPPPAKMYTDEEASYASNENAINWNAPLVFLLGMTGAAIVLFLLLIVGFLLFFNMTIGDVFTAWQHRQTEVGPATAPVIRAGGPRWCARR